MHPRPPARGPAQGGRRPGLLCDLQPAPPSLARFLCGRGRLCSGLGLSCLGSLLSLTSPGDPGGLGGGAFGVRADFWGPPWPSSRCLMGFHLGGSSSWPQPCPPALPTPVLHKQRPCVPRLAGLTGNPLRNRVDFLKGGGGLSWRGLLTQDHPSLAHGPPLRARPGMAASPVPRALKESA